MSFRTKLSLIFVLTIVGSVCVVAYGVTHYTQAAFDEMDAQRTTAIISQFKKEYSRAANRSRSRSKTPPTPTSACAPPSTWRGRTPINLYMSTTRTVRRRTTNSILSNMPAGTARSFRRRNFRRASAQRPSGSPRRKTGTRPRRF